MKVRYYFRVITETNDYVETLGEINDALQDGLKREFEFDDISINFGNITIEKLHTFDKKASENEN